MHYPFPFHPNQESMINSKMKDDEKKEKEVKPDEELEGSVAAHLVIKDTKTGKVIVNTRG